jgi:hypothetical protein
MRGLGNFDPAAQLIEVIDGKTYGDEGQYKFLAEGGTSMFRGLILISIVLIALSAGHAAELDGVTMPETRIIDGKQMQLNGIGLRTYSVFAFAFMWQVCIWNGEATTPTRSCSLRKASYSTSVFFAT